MTDNPNDNDPARPAPNEQQLAMLNEALRMAAPEFHFSADILRLAAPIWIALEALDYAATLRQPDDVMKHIDRALAALNSYRKESLIQSTEAAVEMPLMSGPGQDMDYILVDAMKAQFRGELQKAIDQTRAHLASIDVSMQGV